MIARTAGSYSISAVPCVPTLERGNERETGSMLARGNGAKRLEPPMTGKERILAALNIKTPDRVPLYIHGINEAPILGIARHLMEGLPEPRQFHDMTDMEKMKLVEALFVIHEHFGVDGISCFEIGHETALDEKRLRDDWGTVYIRNPHGLPVPKGHPLQDPSALASFRPP